MSSQEDKELEKMILEEMKKELDRVSKDVEATLKKNVVKLNRSVYDPKIYRRSNQILNSISTDNNEKEAIIYWKGLDYDNTNNPEQVIERVNEGFGEAPFDMYNSRPKQDFVGQTVQEINRKYGENICEEIRW